MKGQKKSLLSRILVLTLVAILFLGLIVGSAYSAFATDVSQAPDGSVIEITDFDTGSLRSAIDSARGDTDMNNVRSISVSGGILNETDLTHIKMMSGLKTCDLSGCTIERSAFPEQVFNGFSSLESFRFPKGVREIGSYAFASCNNLVDISIPVSVTKISDYAFQNCQALENISLPQRLSTLGEGAFYGTKISSISLPSTLTEIPSHCFNKCGYLEEIEIPSSVEKIGSWAFADCTALKSVMLMPQTAPEIGADVFPHDAEIYIVKGAKGYLEGDWTVYYISGEADGDSVSAIVTQPVEDFDIDTEQSSTASADSSSSVDVTESTESSSDSSDDDDSDSSDAVLAHDTEADNDRFIKTCIICVLGAIVITRILMFLFGKIDEVLGGKNG